MERARKRKRKNKDERGRKRGKEGTSEKSEASYYCNGSTRIVVAAVGYGVVVVITICVIIAAVGPVHSDSLL